MNAVNKVMIIDDKDTFILPLEMGLKKRGIDVISFTNPEEAIEYLKNNTIHVLLTDYHMEPNINGDEVIRRVREFNKDIIIYLQTGYSETLPADEMLEKYDIQGYIDKGEGQDKNIQLVKASLKQAELLEKVKEQQIQISKLEYHSSFVGKFFNKILGQIREEGMVIGPLSDIMAQEDEISIEDRKKYSMHIKEAVEKLTEMTKTMEFDSLEIIQASKLNEVLNKIFEIDLMVYYAKINVNYDKDILLNCDSKVLIYLIVETIQDLLENENEKEININITGLEEKNVLIINNQISSDILFDKLLKIAEFDSNIDIKNNENKIEIKF